MPSRSSRRKSDLNNPELLAGLLRHGARFTSPTESLIEAAACLERCGLITTQTREFVRCARPEDLDFSESNRQCCGTIYVDGIDDDDNDGLHCPECDRLVFAAENKKQRFAEL